MRLDEKGVDVARKATALQFPGTWMDEMCLTFTRAYLSALPASPVSELVGLMLKVADSERKYGFDDTEAALRESASTLTTISTRNAELEAENERLRDERHVAVAAMVRSHERAEAAEAQVKAMDEALAFYADVSKYPATFTGGMGALWRDCGEIARRARAVKGRELDD